MADILLSGDFVKKVYMLLIFFGRNWRSERWAATRWNPKRTRNKNWVFLNLGVDPRATVPGRSCLTYHTRNLKDTKNWRAETSRGFFEIEKFWTW